MKLAIASGVATFLAFFSPALWNGEPMWLWFSGFMSLSILTGVLAARGLGTSTSSRQRPDYKRIAALELELGYRAETPEEEYARLAGANIKKIFAPTGSFAGFTGGGSGGPSCRRDHNAQYCTECFPGHPEERRKRPRIQTPINLIVGTIDNPHDICPYTIDSPHECL